MFLETLYSIVNFWSRMTKCFSTREGRWKKWYAMCLRAEDKYWNHTRVMGWFSPMVRAFLIHVRTSRFCVSAGWVQVRLLFQFGIKIYIKLNFSIFSSLCRPFVNKKNFFWMLYKFFLISKIFKVFQDSPNFQNFFHICKIFQISKHCI